ncbi:hypothetical protein TNCV_3150971 [Trichonephila clavipes]|nr:hypothetical protein TNCV_3150971 [Trichonephila clavipes]
MLWEGKLLVETILRQTRTPSSVHSQREWDKLPQQLLDNVVQSMGSECTKVEICRELNTSLPVGSGVAVRKRVEVQAQVSSTSLLTMVQNYCWSVTKSPRVAELVRR